MIINIEKSHGKFASIELERSLYIYTYKRRL